MEKYSINHFGVLNSHYDRVSKIWISYVDIIFSKDPELYVNDCMCRADGKIAIRVVSHNTLDSYRCEVYDKESPEGMLHRFLVDASFSKWRSTYGEYVNNYNGSMPNITFKNDGVEVSREAFESALPKRDPVYNCTKEELIEAIGDILYHRKGKSLKNYMLHFHGSKEQCDEAIDKFDKAMRKIYCKEQNDVKPVVVWLPDTHNHNHIMSHGFMHQLRNGPVDECTLPEHEPLDMEKFKQRWIDNITGTGHGVVYQLRDSCQSADLKTIEELNIKAMQETDDDMKDIINTRKVKESSDVNPATRTKRGKKR